MRARQLPGIALGAMLVLAVLGSLGLRPLSPHDTMLSVLGASGPHPSLGADARAFDQLVGQWDADFTFYDSAGAVRHKQGEVLFGWVLDGNAVQDVWITYPAAGERERRIGTTIRMFDKSTGQWRIVFAQPQFDYIVTAQGRAEGNRIVLNGRDADSLPFRWSFNDVTKDSFVWRGEKSFDGGKSWKLEEEHHMRRRLAQQQGKRSDAVFKQLTSLIGEWQGSENGVALHITYTLLANGTALMEQMAAAGESPMITMFTVHGDQLLATHYCVAGNQPQMAASAPNDLKDGLTFSLLRITGMKTPGDWHNTGVTISLDDSDHMTQRWTYAYKGKTGTNVFHYSRKK